MAGESGRDADWREPKTNGLQDKDKIEGRKTRRVADSAEHNNIIDGRESLND